MGKTFLATPPEEVIALWPKRQPGDHIPDIRNWLLGLVVPFFLLSIITIIARLLVRWRRKNLALDDWLLATVLPPTISVNVLLIRLFTIYQVGKHLWDISITKKQGEELRIYLWLTCLSLTFCHYMNRFSVLASYYRVFGKGEKKLRWIMHFVTVLQGASFIEVFVSLIFQCVPTRAFWDVNVVNPKCDYQRPILTAMIVQDCFFNFAVFGLPLKRIWKVQMPQRDKIGLIGIFGIGYIVCVISAVKVWIWVRAMFYNPLHDLTWSVAPFWLLCSMQNSLHIICISVPALRHWITCGGNRNDSKAIKSKRTTGSFTLGRIRLPVAATLSRMGKRKGSHPHDMSTTLMTDREVVITVTDNDTIARSSDECDAIEKSDIDIEKNAVEIEENIDMERFDRSVSHAIEDFKTEKRPFRHTIG